MNGASRTAKLVATSGAILAFGVLLLAPPAQAYSRNLHIAAFVQVFANGIPAEVRCPDSPDEWGSDLGDPLHPEEIYGRTFTQTEVVEFRADLCPILDNLASSNAEGEKYTARRHECRCARRTVHLIAVSSRASPAGRG